MSLAVQPVSTTDGSLITSVRETLRGADQALVLSAFVADAGVHLVKQELEGLGSAARLLTTTVFGSTSTSALAKAASVGTEIRTLNPRGAATYHPKLYIGKHGEEIRAVVGSANLTRGLVCNIELACSLRGPAETEQLNWLWHWAETTWGHADSCAWSPQLDVDRDAAEVLAPDLATWLTHEVAKDPLFMTLGASPRPNMVCEVTPTTLFIETARSKQRGQPPQPVPAWMLNLAWEYLKVHGRLSNRYLLDELRVHRSSAVCALLARHPHVERVPGRGVCLRWGGG